MSKWNPKQRERVKKRTNGRCGYCGCELGGKYHIDHRISKSDHRYFGIKHPDREENLIAACSSCNILKGSNDPDRFRSLITGFHETLLRDARYRCLVRYGRLKESTDDLVFYYETIDNG
jgi:5-methylcytosine-specific restriction endonuclease McrA